MEETAFTEVSGSTYDICAGTNFRLNAQFSGGTEPYDHLWSGDTGPLSAVDVPNPLFTTATPGEYLLTYKMTDADGKTAYQTISIQVHANPSPSISAHPGASGCAGEGLILYSDQCYDEYCWQPGAGCGASNSIEVDRSGSYTLTVTDEYGCSGTSSPISVTINQAPRVNVNTNAPLCETETLNLYSTVSGGSTPYTYSWSGPDGFTSSVANPTIGSATLSAAGTYILEVTDGSGCGSDVASVRVEVNPAVVISSHPADQTVSSGNDVSFSVVASGIDLSFQWQRNTGTGWGNIGGANSNIYTATNVTASWDGYQFRCIVTGNCESGSVISDPATLTVPSGSETYYYTGTEQSFTVPVGVNSVLLEVWGAQGNNNAGLYCGQPGKGGFAQGYLSVTPGETIYIYVGGQDGWNGGGTGGGTSSYRGGDGGGASDVRQGGNAIGDRVIVAGAGGGAGGGGGRSGGGGGGAGGGGTGGEGGINTSYPAYVGYVGYGGNGGNGANYSSYVGGGGGGFPTAGSGGAAGAPGNEGSAGEAGDTDGIGEGGDGVTNPFSSSYGSGGGGGGYHGGGSGGVFGRYSSSYYYGGQGGGGGGSSYIGGVSGGSTTPAVQEGPGLIRVSW